MKKLKWTTEKRKVKDLKLYPENPRDVTDFKLQKLTESLEKMDLVEIPAIDKDNTIIAGNQRIKVLLEMGKENDEIEVRVPNRKLTKKEFEFYLLTSNLPTGEWNFESLLQSFDLDYLDNLGFDKTILSNLSTFDSIDPNDEWKEMPEYENKDLSGIQIMMHFKERKDIQQFAALIGCKITEKTKYLWFPPKE